MDDLIHMFQLVGVGFMLMLPLGNPLTSMTMLLSLGEHLTPAQRNREIRNATFYVMAIMLVTFYLGAVIIHSLGISIPGLRVAGGMIVAFIGFTMLFPKNTDDAADDVADDGTPAKPRRSPRSIAFVPLALPGTAGPGCMAMIISLASKYHSTNGSFTSWMMLIVPLMIVGLLGLLFWCCLRSSTTLMRFLGSGGIDAISRIMGFLLVCIGVQIVIDGITEVILGTAA